MTPRSGTGGLTEEERSFALDRFRTIRPFLEDGMPLPRIAKENHVNLRTLRRRAKDYRQLCLAELCRQSRTDKLAAILRVTENFRLLDC